MQIRFKKLHPEAKMPTYATSGAACFDIYALCHGQKVLYEMHSTAVGTGLSVEVPEGYVMLIYSRSGHAWEYGVRLSNSVGVIDSDYRGEIMVMLTKDWPWGHFPIKSGDRIAQGMIIPINQVEFTEVNELSLTERGNGGFGSTGA